MNETVITFGGGTMRFIYTDALAPLMDEGAFTVTRASHVEPHPRGGWYADMQPSGGPVLGLNGTATAIPRAKWDTDADYQRVFTKFVEVFVTPFPTRQAALDAEVAWLREKRGL